MFLGFALFLLYTRFQNLICFFRTPSNRSTPAQNSSFPSHGAQQDATMPKDTNAEQETISVSSTMQPTNTPKDMKAEREVVFASHSMLATH